MEMHAIQSKQASMSSGCIVDSLPWDYFRFRVTRALS